MFLLTALVLVRWSFLFPVRSWNCTALEKGVVWLNEHFWYRSHWEDIIGYEEGSRPDAFPHTPLTQWASSWGTGGLDKDKGDRRVFSLLVGIYRHCVYCVLSYIFHLSSAHDERWAGRDAVGTVCDRTGEALVHLHQGVRDLWPQEIFLQMRRMCGEKSLDYYIYEHSVHIETHTHTGLCEWTLSAPSTQSHVKTEENIISPQRQTTSSFLYMKHVLASLMLYVWLTDTLDSTSFKCCSNVHSYFYSINFKWMFWHVLLISCFYWKWDAHHMCVERKQIISTLY